MSNTLNTNTGPNDPSLQYNVGTNATDQTQAAAQAAPAGQVQDPNKSTLEKSQIVLGETAKGYAQVAKQPGLVPPGAVPAGAAQAGLNKIVGDMPEIVHHLIGQMMQANPPHGLTAEELLEELIEEEEQLPPSDDPDVQKFAQTAGIEPEKAMHQVFESANRSTLFLMPDAAQKVLKAIENFHKDGTMNPALKELVLVTFADLLTNPKTKGLNDVAQFVAAFLENPDDPNIPDDIKAKLVAVVGSIVSTVKAKSTTLAAQVTPPNTPIINPRDNQMGLDGLSTAKEANDRAQALIATLPQTPDTMNYMNFLQVVGAQIAKLQECIYSTEASQGQISDKINKGRMEAQLDSLHQQQAAADAADKQQSHEKHGPGKIFSEIGDWIQKITLYVAGAVTADGYGIYAVYKFESDPKGAAAINNAITSFCQKVGDFVAKTVLANMLQELTKFPGLDKIPGMKKAAEQMAKTVTEIVDDAVTVVVAVAAETMVSGGNPLLAIDLMTQGPDPNDPNSRGGAIANLTKACGGSPEQIAIVDAVVNGVAQIVLAIALAVVTGGASATASAAEITTSLTEAAAEALEVTAQTIQKATTIVKALMTAFSLTLTAMNTWQGVVTYNNDLIMLAITKIKSQSQAMAELISGFVELIKKIVEDLLSIMSTNSDFLQILGNFQQSKYADASATTSQALQG